MADHSKPDTQFILDSNQTHHKEKNEELSSELHRSVRSNKAKLDEHETMTSLQDLRPEIQSLYKSVYEESSHFEEAASKLLHSSIQKMQSITKHSKHSKFSKSPKIKFSKPMTPSIPKKPMINNLVAENLNLSKTKNKMKRRQKNKKKKEPKERFTASWNQSILNKKIKVYWPLDSKYYRGIVSSINESRAKPIYVKYRDGDKEWLDLKKEKFIFYDISSSEEQSSEDLDNDSSNDQDIDIMNMDIMDDTDDDAENIEDVDIDLEDKKKRKHKLLKKLKKKLKKKKKRKKRE